MKINRRELLSLGAKATMALTAGRFFVTESRAAETHPVAEDTKFKDAFLALDGFVKQYMREMNSPGMILVLSDRAGIRRTMTYGLSDLEQNRRVAPNQLFHIGSISKSFTANAVLQLREEGKLDLDKPILDYLPWLKIETKYAPITIHHLLTHTSGLPGNVSIFLSDPAAKHKTGFAPGEHFHYCNLGFDILGHLVSQLDKRSYGESIRRRILQPLEMNATEPTINSDFRDRTAKNYMAYHDERPSPRGGKLAEAPQLIFEKGSGSIASTAGDMGLYINMLVNRGKGAKKRVLSEDSFKLFTKPYIKAEEFSPTASYGYGIAVDQLDGHTILRHTGGMVSFMSALQVDIDEGVGAFASINAMQGYRPNPVAMYALKTMRAANANQPMPQRPTPNPLTRIEKAADYAGVFTAPDGRKLEFTSAAGNALFVLYKGKRLQLETTAGGGFLIPHRDFERFLISFNREKGKDTPVTEVSYGADWYANDKYKGERNFSLPKEWSAFVGHYRNDSPWIGSVRIVPLKGKLRMDGLLPLEAIDSDTFRLADEPQNPEWIAFLDVVNGKAMHLKFSGEDYWRVESK
ncbi:MAG: beta-lactamase family protein [Acidobacteria bacterium]|jgi:CubicO group peptidase (beta-lactamase class C family)|nr:beta-lactamase family protein [Acidobacteriota bacterium]